MRQSSFYHQNSNFDAQPLIHKYAHPNTKACKGYATNFAGLKVKAEYLPECVMSHAGAIESTVCRDGEKKESTVKVAGPETP